MKRSMSVVLASVLSASAWGADLLTVYRDALQNDAQFMAAKAAREAGQEKAVQGRAGLLPGIGLSASTSWNTNTYTGTDRDFNANAYGAELRQPVFNQANWAQFRQGQLQTALADMEFEAARQDVIVRVAERYFAVLNARDTVTSLRTLREAAARQLELARKSFEVGTVTVTDVHEAQSRFDLTSAQVIAAENTLEVARQSLAQVTGKAPEVLNGLRDGASLTRPQPDDIVQWVEAAREHSTGVQIQQIGVGVMFIVLVDPPIAAHADGHVAQQIAH